MKPSHNYLIISSLTLLAQNFAIAALHDTSGNAPPSKEKAASALANIAVPFEENRGQTDSKVVFQAHSGRAVVCN